MVDRSHINTTLYIIVEYHTSIRTRHIETRETIIIFDQDTFQTEYFYFSRINGHDRIGIPTTIMSDLILHGTYRRTVYRGELSHFQWDGTILRIVSHCHHDSYRCYYYDDDDDGYSSDGYR